MGQFSKNYRTFYPKSVNKLLKIWVWFPGSRIRDPGSGKNLFRIPDPEVKKAPDPGSGSATLLHIILYLIVDLPEGGRHLVGERAGHNDDVSLTRRRAEHDPVPALKGLSHEMYLAFDDMYV